MVGAGIYADFCFSHSFGGGCGRAVGCGRKCLILDNRIVDRAFNVVGWSHEGISKKVRQSEIPGLDANGKILAVTGLELLPVLHAQMRNIAMDKKRAPDDLAHAATHGIRFFLIPGTPRVCHQVMCAGTDMQERTFLGLLP